MNTTLQFLDAVKLKHGIESDYGLAKLLGVGGSCIGNYRSKRSYLDDKMALKVAEALGIDWAYVAACANSERAKDAGMKAKWAGLAEKIGSMAATVILGIAAYTLPLPPAHAGSSLMPHAVYYVKLYRGMESIQKSEISVVKKDDKSRKDVIPL